MAFEFLRRRLLARDIKALGELFEQYYDAVYKAAYFVTRDRMLAEDVAQETFLKAYDKIDQLQDASRVHSWLLRIAVNKARDHLRSRQRHPVSPEGNAGIAGNPDDIPEARLLAKEECAVLNAGIDNLASEYQEVLFLKYHYEYTTKRIAEVLGIPEGTVKTRLRKARSLLEESLQSAGLMETVSGGEPLAPETGR